MAKDLRASQLQTTQIIASGSSGTGARIVFYPHEVQSTANPNEGIIDSSKFNTSSIGRDAFIFVSGGIGQRNTATNAVAVFGGDVFASGTFAAASGLSGSLTTLVDGTPYLIAGTNITLSTGSNGAITINSSGGGGGADADWTLTGSTLYTTSSIVVGEAGTVESYGSDVFVFISGAKASATGSTAGTAVFGGDVRISGSLLAIAETSDDNFYQPPHVIVNNNTGGVGTVGDGGLFFASVGNLGLSGGTQHAGGIELSILNTFPGGVTYVPSQSQIIIKNESNGSVHLNSNSSWGGGAVAVGVGSILNHEVYSGELALYSDFSFISMSAFNDIHIKAGDDESSTVKFYTFAIPDAIELTDINNTAITSSLQNRTIIGAINELKVSASAGGGGGSSTSVWTDAGTYIYNTASMRAASSATTSIVTGSSLVAIIGSSNSQLRAGTGFNAPTSSFIIGSSASYISGSTESGILASRAAQITLNAEGLGIYNSFDGYIADPGGWGTFRSTIHSSETAKILGGFSSMIMASAVTTISQSDYSAILSSLYSDINLQSGGSACTIIGGYLSEIKTNGAGYSTIIGPGIRNYNDYQIHIGFGGFATYGGNTPLVVISGSAHFTSGSGATFFNGLSGSLTRLSDGTPYLIAGTNVTLSTGSNGAITINSAGGGGGGDTFFFSNEENIIETTGSVKISGSLMHGGNSFSIGEASHAEGFVTIASGAYSHAEGRATIAYGYGSHAEGDVTRAGAQAYIISSIDNANGIFTLDSSHGDVTGQIFVGLFYTTNLENGYGYVRTAVSFDGTNTHVTASDAIRLGGFYGTHLWNRNDTAENTLFVLGSGSHSEGTLTYAVGERSHAEGSGSIAIGAFSLAVGETAVAYGKSSFAAGQSTNAIAPYSFAGGAFTRTYGDWATAFGGVTEASGTFSTTFGAYTIASGSGQVVAGNYNQRGNDFSLFVIGDGVGTDDVDRGDIFRVNAGSAIGHGRVEITGSVAATRGLSGSLTTLTDGSPYLIAGNNITISTGANGAVTITGTAAGGVEAINGFSTEFTTLSWQLVGSDLLYTISGSTHGLNTANLQIQLFQSGSEGFYLVTAQETLINSSFDVRFTISSGSAFDGKVVLLKSSGVDNYWTDEGNLLSTTSSVEMGGNVSIGGQAYPTATGSLTLTGSSLVTDFNNSNVHYYLMTSSVSLSTASNMQPGASYVWIMRQDGTGGHTLSFDTNYFTILGTNNSIVTSSNKTTILSGISDGSKIFLAIAGDES